MLDAATCMTSRLKWVIMWVMVVYPVATRRTRTHRDPVPSRARGSVYCRSL
jgi:hypothetical protein